MQKIQAKVSYRIPLVGGFTDFQEFYKDHGGQTISCAIDKFASVCVVRNRLGGVNIQTKSDLPYGIGLGSSGAFHSALILALTKCRQERLSKLTLAKLAYQLETGVQKFSTGRQDSLACLFRGVSKITYGRDDSIAVERITLSRSLREKLNSRLLLFDTGARRHAFVSIKDVLLKQNKGLLKKIAELPRALTRAWSLGNIDFLGTAIDLQEGYRSELSPSCKSYRTDRLLAIARRCGAGARLTGAGVGCLLCYCVEEHQGQLRKELNIPEMKFSILW